MEGESLHLPGRDSSRLAITSSAGTPPPPESLSPSFMTSSLGWVPAQCLVPGINTSWQQCPSPLVFLLHPQAALPRASTHQPTHQLLHPARQESCCSWLLQAEASAGILRVRGLSSSAALSPVLSPCRCSPHCPPSQGSSCGLSYFLHPTERGIQLTEWL
jgi:hypothetical protein